MNNGLLNVPRSLTLDPQNLQTLYAVVSPYTRDSKEANVPFSGVFKSTNGGENLASINEGLPTVKSSDNADILPPVDVISIIVDPRNPTILYAKTDTSPFIFKSINGGITWNALVSTGLPAQNFPSFTFGLEIDPRNGDLYVRLLGPSLDSGTSSLYRSTDGGVTWLPTGLLSPFTPLTLEFDPRNPLVFYAADLSNIQKSIDDGITWSPVTGTA